MYISDAGAVNLAVGVIEQAVADYRFAQKMSRAEEEKRNNWARKSGSHDPRAARAPKEQIEKLEAFFLGRWFHTLADLDGAKIVELLRSPAKKRMMKTFHKSDGSRPALPPEPKGKPGRPIDWDAVARWPDIKARLDAGGYSRKQVALEMGCCDASALVKLMRGGTEKTRRRMLEALDRLER